MKERVQIHHFIDGLFRQLRFRHNHTFWVYLILYVLMLLLPFTILLGYYYPTSRQIIIDNQNAAGKRNVEQIKVNMDNQLRAIYNLPSALYSHKNLRWYDLTTSVLSRYDAKYELFNLIRSNSFIDEILLYIQKLEQFIGPSGNGSFHISQLQSASNVYGVHFPDWDYEEMRTMLNTVTSNQIRIFRDITIDSYKYSEAVCFIMPLLHNKYNYAVVLVFVSSEQLAQLGGHLSMADEREILYFDGDGQLVYDTAHRSRQDIQTITDVQSNDTDYISLSDGQYLFSSAKSDRFGWRFVSLLSYDTMMADMRTLNRNSIALVAIILVASIVLIGVSMRRTYSPIRALSGLSNSVLKALPPSNRGTRRDEMETVSDALSGLQQYSQQLNSSLNEARPMMRDYLIGSILQNSAQNAADAAKDLIRFGLYLTAPYRAACARYHTNDEREQAHGMLNELIDQDIQISAVRGQRVQELYMLISGAADVNRLRELLNGFPPYRQLALGESVDELADISVSYRHALEVMEELRLRDTVGQSLEYSGKESAPDLSIRYPLELMTLLESALLRMETDAVNEVAERVISLLSDDNLPPHFVRSIYMNAASMIVTAMSHQHFADIADVGKLCSAEMLAQMTCQEMIASLRSVAGEYVVCYGKREGGLSRHIEKAARYIQEHLSDMSLSLLGVADVLEMSPSNLSRSFKAEMGKGFKEYVDLMRLEEAKRLLRDTQLSIETVSGRVGYENASSFSRRFRAMRGISPSEYRSLKNGESGGSET